MSVKTFSRLRLQSYLTKEVKLVTQNYRVLQLLIVPIPLFKLSFEERSFAVPIIEDVSSILRDLSTLNPPDVLNKLAFKSEGIHQKQAIQIRKIGAFTD